MSVNSIQMKPGKALIKPGIFYGWWILVVTFLCMFVSGGVGYYAFSLFYKPLQAEFGWSRGAISVAYTVNNLVMAFSSPFIGRVVDRYGAKVAITAGAAVAGVGFAILSQMNNLVLYYLAYCLIGAGLQACGLIATTKVTSNWFLKKRGLALGLMSSGFGIGGLVLAPVISSWLIPDMGWRTAYLALGLLTLVAVIPLSLLVLKTAPADMGLYPDGAPAPAATAVPGLDSVKAPTWTLKMALGTSTFWLITIAFLTSNFSHIGVMQHQVNYITDIGFPAALAASALGTVGLGSAINKVISGWLSDKISAKHVSNICFAFKLAATVIIVIIRPASPAIMVWLYAIFMGIGVGGWTAPQSMLFSSNFGMDSYGTILGMATMLNSFACAFSPLLAGYMFDMTGSYSLIFNIFLVLSAVALPLMFVVRKPKLPEGVKKG